MDTNGSGLEVLKWDTLLLIVYLLMLLLLMLLIAMLP